MAATVKLYSLDLRMTKTYVFAIVFIMGNLLLPRLIHTVPMGGITFLPIYFFTLIAAYKYGIGVGMLTALLSPVLNHLIFGMPPMAVLPIILIKSTLLAVAAAMVAQRTQVVSVLNLLLVVLLYQIVGTGFEWMMVGDFWVAVQDFRIGLPGMFIQIVGGYFVLKSLAKL